MGLSQNALLIRQDADAWIKIRQRAGDKNIGKLESIDIARAIFQAWDSQEKGYLSFEELTE